MKKPSLRLWEVFEKTSEEITKTKTLSGYTDKIERQSALMFVEIGKILDEIVDWINIQEKETDHKLDKIRDEDLRLPEEKEAIKSWNLVKKDLEGYEPKEKFLRDAEIGDRLDNGKNNREMRVTDVAQEGLILNYCEYKTFGELKEEGYKIKTL